VRNPVLNISLNFYDFETINLPWVSQRALRPILNSNPVNFLKSVFLLIIIKDLSLKLALKLFRKLTTGLSSQNHRNSM
jgi:hypothetical protein